MKLLIVNGSGRQYNNSRLVCKQVSILCEDLKIKSRTIDLYDVYNTKDKLKKIFQNYNCILWVSPEYNRSFSANIKHFIEILGVELFQSKINGIISTSIGESSRAGLNQMANLLFSMDTLIVPPGIEYNHILHVDDTTIDKILILLKNMQYFSKKIYGSN
ncbi:NAD(P)H-dependent oxidoreductase [Streptococcus pasteurianus]|uniref:NADPH-dependent FMN reductase n=1 Tax=Bacillota TaxID=1239 RepID=UPI000E3F0AE3|nr:MULTISPECIES: NAD(P)H-dependent oxidoreductase [Bacillota]MDY4237165.1 NAD(P)H-dependent oxidoreductase [Bacilli bacterium]MCO7183246.1 NAD(P)H-dependent oxidoreductase [Streptococcus gallolyticus]MDV5118375.1 NAD(P)H-dependent oxidoreductase [Streptococcus pasteurianus]MDV5123053.1 NAD(P)H-dependent oxidoreductase [Streptococcus pasteurianus]MDV5134732.1 NAD(P)H-dependent oxidoreductase [Streptococcus pasteurianus]